MVPHRPKWFHRLGAWIVFAAEHALTATLRVDWKDHSDLFDSDKPAQSVIFCTWHNRLSTAMWLYRQRPLKNHPQRRMAALVSASKDGAFLAAILERFGVQPVRGSSSRRGSQAMLELTSWAEQGYDLAITPDGPRGPRYVVQEGAIALAQLTDLPIVPVSCWCDRRWTLKSWDAFQIPRPFARCEVSVGEVLRVPREASDVEREALRAELEAKMRAITKD